MVQCLIPALHHTPNRCGVVPAGIILFPGSQIYGSEGSLIILFSDPLKSHPGLLPELLFKEQVIVIRTGKTGVARVSGQEIGKECLVPGD
jgi:hypothetical protein